MKKLSKLDSDITELSALVRRFGYDWVTDRTCQSIDYLSLRQEVMQNISQLRKVSAIIDHYTRLKDSVKDDVFTQEGRKKYNNTI